MKYLLMILILYGCGNYSIDMTDVVDIGSIDIIPPTQVLKDVNGIYSMYTYQSLHQKEPINTISDFSGFYTPLSQMKYMILLGNDIPLILNGNNLCSKFIVSEPFHYAVNEKELYGITRSTIFYSGSLIDKYNNINISKFVQTVYPDKTIVEDKQILKAVKNGISGNKSYMEHYGNPFGWWPEKITDSKLDFNCDFSTTISRRNVSGLYKIEREIDGIKTESNFFMSLIQLENSQNFIAFFDHMLDLDNNGKMYSNYTKLFLFSDPIVTSSLIITIIRKKSCFGNFDNEYNNFYLSCNIEDFINESKLQETKEVIRGTKLNYDLTTIVK